MRLPLSVYRHAWSVGSAKASVQKTQIVGLFLGLIVMAVVSLVDYQHLILRFSLAVFTSCNLVLLALVELMGQRRERCDPLGIDRSGLQVFSRPSLSKIIIIIFFAYFFMKYQGDAEHDNGSLAGIVYSCLGSHWF